MTNAVERDQNSIQIKREVIVQVGPHFLFDGSVNYGANML